MSTIDTPEPQQVPQLPKLRPSPKVTLEITEEIIARSIRADSTSCMIADAVKQQVPNASSVSVDLQSIRWTDRSKGLRYVYLTPSNAQGALIMFDQGMEMEAFTVKLRGAQVTRSKTLLPHVPRIPRTGSNITPEQREAKEAARAERSAVLAERKERAEAEGRVGPSGRVIGDPIAVPPGPLTMASGRASGTTLPIPRGGRPPKTAALPSKIRAFGARGLRAPNVKATGKPGSWVDPDASIDG